MAGQKARWIDFALLLVLAGLALAQFALFLPNNHVVSDIWDYWRFQDLGISLLYQPTVRPLGHSLFWMAWSVSPHSWTLLNLTQIAVMIFKASATYWFVTLVLNRPAGLLASALILVMPAAFGIYSMWTVNVHFIFACLIVALASLVWIARSFRIDGAALMVLALAYSLLSYDMGWPLALLGPAVLLVSRPNPSWRRALVLWYGTILITVAIIAAGLILAGGQLSTTDTGVHFARQSSVIDLSLETLPASIASFFSAYRIHLIGVFEESLAYIPRSLRSPLVQLALACGAVLGITLVAMTWRESRRVPGRIWAGAALLGLLYIGLGYAPITITLLRTDRFHEFIYSSLGASLFFAAMIVGLHNTLARKGMARVRAASIVLGLVAGALMALFTFRSLDLTLALISVSNQQKSLLESIVVQVPDPLPGSAVFVFDRDRRLFDLFEQRPDRIGYALGTVYEDQALPVFVCRKAGDPPGYTSACDVQADRVLVDSDPGESPQVFLREQSAIFQTSVNDQGELRAELISIGQDVLDSDRLPGRFGLLETSPLPSRN